MSHFNHSTLDDLIPKTTKALVDDLLGPDCPKRRERVGDLVAIYQPVLKRVVAGSLRRYVGDNFNEADVEDLVADEIARMLDPQQSYFQSYDPNKGRLRHWIKSRIRNHTLDHLRKRAVRSSVELDESLVGKHIDEQINVEEIYAVFNLAFGITRDHYSEKGESERFQAFVQSKSKDKDAKAGLGKWSEWQLRGIKSEIWGYIRENALMQAALRISDQPDDVYDLVRRVWDALKSKRVEAMPV